MSTSSQILSVLEYMEKEKGISRADMIETISEAIRTAALKSITAGQDIRVEINPRTGQLQAWAVFEIVDSVSDPRNQMHISKALLIDNKAEVGSVVETEIDPALLGRIVAQIARQAIMQRIKLFEKEKIYDDFKNRVGDIVSCVVHHVDNGNVYVEIGNTEALLPARECIYGEEYASGDRVRCLLLKLNTESRDTDIILSRSHVNFVRRLLEIEVSEIADGSVFIRGIAREPGYRTKICVDTKDKNIDPVGACVGTRGVRIKSIVRELNGEKIDVIRYYDDPQKLLCEAIKPAIPKNVRVNEAEHRIYFEVAEGDLAVAIGKRGLNAKLTSKMINWRLDISKESVAVDNFDDKLERAVTGWADIPGITKEVAHKLVAAGITDVEAFESVDTDDLANVGFSQKEAEQTVQCIREFCRK
ncbi:MAG: transcription termination factor NusA [Puniceicoccales bacterium]|jgi:N utilization substance protein A|nr:transcription termination factor NusA [Puniceicoccales bacterium]